MNYQSRILAMLIDAVSYTKLACSSLFIFYTLSIGATLTITLNSITRKKGAAQTSQVSYFVSVVNKMELI